MTDIKSFRTDILRVSTELKVSQIGFDAETIRRVDSELCPSPLGQLVISVYFLM